MIELGNWRNMNYLHDYLNKQLVKDPEKYIHNPNLYAIWNIKAYVCLKVIQLNPFDSQFFIYTDLGAWRQGIFNDWPDNNFINFLYPKLNHRMLFSQIYYVHDVNMFNVETDSIEGGFFAGSKSAIKLFANNFYEEHDKRLKSNLFIGKDQTIMNYIVYKLNNTNHVLLRAWQLHECNLNKTNILFDPWFFYQQYFSTINYYNCSFDNKLTILTNI